MVFGATVGLADLDTDEEFTYKIVGEDEASIEKRLLSITSPLAKGLIGKEEGDEARIQTPKGVRKMEILSIEMTNELPEV